MACHLANLAAWISWPLIFCLFCKPDAECSKHGILWGDTAFCTAPSMRAHSHTNARAHTLTHAHTRTHTHALSGMQNAESVACLGCHSTGHEKCGGHGPHHDVLCVMHMRCATTGVEPGQQRPLHPSTICSNYLAVLFYEQEVGAPLQAGGAGGWYSSMSRRLVLFCLAPITEHLQAPRKAAGFTGFHCRTPFLAGMPGPVRLLGASPRALAPRASMLLPGAVPAIYDRPAQARAQHHAQRKHPGLSICAEAYGVGALHAEP